jgi:hypothetical protein
MENKEIKLDNNTRFLVSRIVRQYTDSNGRRVNEVKEFIMDKPLELGSLNDPKNTDVVGVAWEDTKPTSKKKSIFGDF